MIKRGKRKSTEGIEFIRMLGDMKYYKNLGILEADNIKQADMNEKNKER